MLAEQMKAGNHRHAVICPFSVLKLTLPLGTTGILDTIGEP